MTLLSLLFARDRRHFFKSKENFGALPHCKRYEILKGDASKTVKNFLQKNKETVISMAFFDMDCLGGRAEIVVFSDCYQSYGRLIDEGKVVFVKGKPSEGSDFSDLKILADEIISVENVRNRLSQCLNIKFTPKNLVKLLSIWLMENSILKWKH